MLACHAEIADTDQLTLLHFHGNGETIADYVDADFHEFRRLGVNVVFVEYRGYGDSTGEPTLVEMLGDGEAVVEALGLSFDRIIAFGRSIGSLYAIELASRRPNTAGLVIESGIADPAERFLTYADLDGTGVTEDQVRAEVSRHFDHEQKLQDYRNPVLILHTEHDGLIDISHAERNYQWSASAEKKLIRFGLGDHNSIMALNRAEYFRAVREFAARIADRD